MPADCVWRQSINLPTDRYTEELIRLGENWLGDKIGIIGELGLGELDASGEIWRDLISFLLGLPTIYLCDDGPWFGMHGCTHEDRQLSCSKSSLFLILRGGNGMSMFTQSPSYSIKK